LDVTEPKGIDSPPALPIAAVERDTGLSKDTLRVWERRYGFPQPLRGELSERSYPPDQVEKLHVIKRLIDQGRRPGQIINLPIDQLLEMTRASHDPAPPPGVLQAAWDEWIMALHAHDAHGLRRMLSQKLLQIGLHRFVVELLAPLNVAVGRAWMAGRLRVFEEHLYTECVQGVLRNAIAHAPRADPPRVLLATLPQEAHALGLLMAEALLTLDGCQSVPLGVQVPMAEIVAATRSHRADVVALSFAASFNPVQAGDALSQLRNLLPGAVEIWAGGQCSALKRRNTPGVEFIEDIGDLPAEVRRWRTGHPAGEPR
jgi:MerR family transcriptional regulator, light-induced transcriptional regulator